MSWHIVCYSQLLKVVESIKVIQERMGESFNIVFYLPSQLPYFGFNIARHAA